MSEKRERMDGWMAGWMTRWAGGEVDGVARWKKDWDALTKKAGRRGREGIAAGS